MLLSLERWLGKVAIVTGASSGIGAKIAQKLVEEGIIVAGLARRSEVIEELSRGLSGAKGKLHAVKVDMRNEEEIIQAYKWISTNLGPISILVNNAAVYHSDAGLMDGKTELWREILETNVLGLSIATREAIKDMNEHKVDGQIININSSTGHCCFPYGRMYSPSKHAVRAISETLRMELNETALKIKISSLSPGLVETDMPPTELLRTKPYLKPEDIANGVVFILSTPPNVQVEELMIKPLGGGLD